MRKTDKKRDNQLRLVLTQACDTALKEIDGFAWLTHIVNYSNFPNSLQVVCVFDTNEQLASYRASTANNRLTALIQHQLTDIGIKLKNVADHISFDSEQDCADEHGGNWAKRLG